MWFNLISCQCVSSKKCASKKRLFCVFSIWCIGPISILEVPFYLVVSALFLVGFLNLLLNLLNPYSICYVVVSHLI